MATRRQTQDGIWKLLNAVQPALGLLMLLMALRYSLRDEYAHATFDLVLGLWSLDQAKDR